MIQTALFPRTAPRRLAGVGTPFRLGSLVDLWRSRQALKRLDARALEDVGLSARDAHEEAAKPVWDVPANWRM